MSGRWLLNRSWQSSLEGTAPGAQGAVRRRASTAGWAPGSTHRQGQDALLEVPWKCQDALEHALQARLLCLPLAALSLEVASERAVPVHRFRRPILQARKSGLHGPRITRSNLQL